MAEVTGFTADRMRVIENTTVVDGEVQGDNLILLTREGTPIDAGNVRGPQGDMGPAGGVTNVNDQTGAIYAPRIFDTKALLDAWTTAPIGAMAVTKDSETVWEKVALGWVIVNQRRVFPDGGFASRWPNPPEGAEAVTVNNSGHLYKHAAAWQQADPIRLYSSTTERDARWLNPPDGALCQAPAGVYWTRLSGAWYRRGQLVHTFMQQVDGSINGLGMDFPLNMPTLPIPWIAKATADVYTGYAPQTGNYVGSIYTNAYPNPNGGAHQKYSPWAMGIQGAVWVGLTPFHLVWKGPAGQAPLGVLRVEAQAVSGFYVTGHVLIEMFAQ